ncbi:MAG TPA: prolyl oligopeptidase family serine peptidase [Kiritimatiellia bacterium]|mgnify:CR=1 FL=1|nr:prolyl oligopeptidase family serine peptidase [Kiritimatiellia bacterium]
MERLDYFFRRLLLMVPTFIGITFVCFALCQVVPGGPVEQALAKMRGLGAAAAPSDSAGPASRPDFAVLVYPVISMDALADAGSRYELLGPDPSPEQIVAYSADRRVTAETAPAFLVHARDDAVVSVENSRRFHAALQSHSVPSACLELDSGGHGLGYGGPLWAIWQAQSLAWLRTQGLIGPPVAGGE